MDNLSWGNPLAHRVRVHYNTASKTIYEGMPVCYNYDTTTNWAGGSVSDEGVVTASTTLTAGSPPTAQAKYLEVEEPNDGNLQWFAGVVAKGGWVGKTTSSTAGVGQLLDIYVPNGAIVPVRAGVGCTVSQTVLSVIAATQYLGHALDATEARPVAIVEETVDRSTAGLILAKLDPNMFIYQEQHGSALLVGTGDTAASATQVVNRINVESAQTAGDFEVLKYTGAVRGGGGIFNGMFRYTAIVDGEQTGSQNIHATTIALVLGADATLANPGYTNSVLRLRIDEEGDDQPDMSGGEISALALEYYIDETGGAPRDATAIHIVAGSDNFDYFLMIQNEGDAGDSAHTATGSKVAGFDTDSLMAKIPIKIAGRGSPYYILAGQAMAEVTAN